MSEKVGHFAERITNTGKTYSMELIIFPLFILILTGTVFNNLSTSGLQTNPVFRGSSNYPIGIVVPNGNNGCDANRQNCNLTAVTSYSFLNKNSPWTILFTGGNVLGFVSGMFSGIYSPNSNGYTGVVVFRNCMNPSNQTGNALNTFVCTDEILEGLTYNPNSPNWLLNSQSGNNSFFTAYGFNCPLTFTHPCNSSISNLVNPLKFNTYGTLNPATYNASISYTGFYNNCLKDNTTYCVAGNHGYWYNWTAGALTTYPAFIYQISVPQSTQQTGANGIQLPGFFSFLGFILGIILLIMSLGLTLSGSFQALASGASASAGVNEQGSRLALVFGAGLILWSFIYSEFGSWMFSFGDLGFGSMLTIIFPAIFFLGLYWRIFSLD